MRVFTIFKYILYIQSTADTNDECQAFDHEPKYWIDYIFNLMVAREEDRRLTQVNTVHPQWNINV